MIPVEILLYHHQNSQFWSTKGICQALKKGLIICKTAWNSIHEHDL